MFTARKRSFRHRCLLVLWLCVSFPLTAGCQEVKPRQSSLDIRTASEKIITYQVELAETSAQKSRGLMYREAMPPDRGMLFIYRPSREVTMWMKNTILSLDMLFIDSNGRIVNIRERTEPMSTRLIPSGAEIRAVLELNAGQVKAHDIREGDTVIHPVFE